MLASRTLRLLGLILAAALLMGSTCNNNDDDPDDTSLPTTPQPTPSVEAVASFQLVGLIDEAFAGQAPPVEISGGGFTDPSPDPSATPQASPSGTTPTRGGIIRLTIEDLSDDLRQACGLDAESVVHVYWTTQTAFDPGDVLDDVEDEIEDRTAGILGSVYKSAEDATAATASPDVSPAATGSPSGSPSASIQGADCLLIADQILLTRTTLPTPRAVARRTATPAPTRSPTPTPARTATPAPATTTPEESEEPTAAPTEEPDPT